MELPLDIYKIVYRYLYSTVLDELTEVYGKTLRLKRVSDDQLCERIMKDVLNHIRFRETKYWRYAVDTGYTPARNNGYVFWWSSWDEKFRATNASSLLIN